MKNTNVNEKMGKGFVVLDKEENVIVTFTNAEYTGWSDTITGIFFGESHAEKIGDVERMMSDDNEYKLKEMIIGNINDDINLLLDEVDIEDSIRPNKYDDLPDVYDLASLRKKIKALSNEQLEEIVKLQFEKEELDKKVREMNERIKVIESCDNDIFEKLKDVDLTELIKKSSLNQGFVNFQTPQVPVLPITKDNK